MQTEFLRGGQIPQSGMYRGSSRFEGFKPPAKPPPSHIHTTHTYTHTHTHTHTYTHTHISLKMYSWLQPRQLEKWCYGPENKSFSNSCQKNIWQRVKWRKSVNLEGQRGALLVTWPERDKLPKKLSLRQTRRYLSMIKISNWLKTSVNWF